MPLKAMTMNGNSIEPGNTAENTTVGMHARLVGIPTKYSGRAPLCTISSRAMRKTLQAIYAYPARTVSSDCMNDASGPNATCRCRTKKMAGPMPKQDKSAN
eukprot:CAMPEP_0170435966 /NCGR_PEP_ID=MMETSP0117_2-20130122/43888_1 /TAXON_ID=400756 /ORGANISM="Durinskia baltica, Strain CSIRO CS-38" /LENGTH=100 /DNA_ID=CAMNT_0010695967 /DNA_START=217 /DNA_END=519 /DNA_ORIENTATION=+